MAGQEEVQRALVLHADQCSLVLSVHPNRFDVGQHVLLECGRCRFWYESAVQMTWDGCVPCAPRTVCTAVFVLHAGF